MPRALYPEMTRVAWTPCRHLNKAMGFCPFCIIEWTLRDPARAKELWEEECGPLSKTLASNDSRAGTSSSSD
jgi:hypothetical protein